MSEALWNTKFKEAVDMITEMILDGQYLQLWLVGGYYTMIKINELLIDCAKANNLSYRFTSTGDLVIGSIRISKVHRNRLTYLKEPFVIDLRELS